MTRYQAELLLSKPVKRNDYFAGKFLGGYILFLTILGFNMVLSVASAFTFFGAQASLEILPGLFVIQAFSSLIFYSLAFMLGELVRRFFPGLHLLLCRLLFQLHNQRLHGPNLQSHREDDIQDGPNLPADFPSELAPDPVRITPATPDSRNGPPVCRCR